MRDGLIIFGVTLLAAGVGYGLGRGEEQLEADYWRGEYADLTLNGSRRLAVACGRSNPGPDRPARRAPQRRR